MPPTPKKCFVISPIGQPGSEVREHADDVFDYIIKPAMDEVGIAVYRADHDPQAGRITDHMFESILTDDLCIAVLSFQNPNVYYELAVAQSAARPVIILNLKGNPLPFDIKDLRVIEYDFRPKSIMGKGYVKQIVEMVRNLEARNWVVSVPFGQNLSPLGRASGRVRFHDRVEGFGTSDAWLSALRDATHAIDLCGPTLRYWAKIPQFPHLIHQKAAAGCRIRILLMHEANPALQHFMNTDLKLKPRISDAEVETSWAFYDQLARSASGVEVRRMRVGSCHQQLLRFDDRLLASLVLFSTTTNYSPMLECSDPSTVYRVMLDEFETLWRANAEAPAPPVA